jgi:hypothetical protein
VLAELELIEPYLLSQRSNPPRPLWQGRSHELSGPGHSCLQDTKSLPILRCAHLDARSMGWSCGVAFPVSLDRPMAKKFDALGNQSSPSLPFAVNKSTRRTAAAAAVRLPSVSGRPEQTRSNKTLDLDL